MYEALLGSEYIGIFRYRDRIYVISEEVGMVTCQQTEVEPRKKTLVLKIHFLRMRVFLLMKRSVLYEPCIT